MSDDCDSKIEVVPRELPCNNSEFRTRLKSLLNECSMENGSNTPDWILRDYLVGCLRVFDAATNARSGWYGHDVPECDEIETNPTKIEETEG